MNDTLVAIIVLYAIWRIAVVAGRREERRKMQSFPFASHAPEARCERCGRMAPEPDLRSRGVWPWRRRVCRDGCPAPGFGGDDADSR